ncbi:cyclin-dependent kinase 1-like [Oppia nitens]|uniref:cyclin-dependent kinase 1-like n=1 Tax=Oppia nitens TaxID=1686743 RepID=UPI0023DC88A5|nr:cyclin-dependent kinase 1-like [Oppia nitens]
MIEWMSNDDVLGARNNRNKPQATQVLTLKDNTNNNNISSTIDSTIDSKIDSTIDSEIESTINSIRPNRQIEHNNSLDIYNRARNNRNKPQATQVPTLRDNTNNNNISSTIDSEIESTINSTIDSTIKVYKVIDKTTKKCFAIKDILIENNKMKNNYLKEIKQLFKLQSDFVVIYYDAWIESKILYIQMELLSQSLKQLIELKAKTFQRKSNQPMDCIEYYITSHIMLELCECVEYLHTRQPPVIHRDLKPGNILINDKPLNNRFLKLCDFGLTTDHNRLGSQSEIHTKSVGTKKYMAPEVEISLNGGKKAAYNEKSDIYSMGCILLDLFDVNKKMDFNLFDELYGNSNLNVYIKSISKLISSMIQPLVLIMMIYLVKYLQLN